MTARFLAIVSVIPNTSVVAIKGQDGQDWQCYDLIFEGQNEDMGLNQDKGTKNFSSTKSYQTLGQRSKWGTNAFALCDNDLQDTGNDYICE